MTLTKRVFCFDIIKNRIRFRHFFFALLWPLCVIGTPCDSKSSPYHSLRVKSLPQPQPLSGLKAQICAFPSQYFSVISAWKLRRSTRFILEAAKRRSPIWEEVNDADSEYFILVVTGLSKRRNHPTQIGSLFCRNCLNAFYHFYQNPKMGKVHNIGGSRHSNCSMLEAIEICEVLTGNNLNYSYTEENRSGDHIWYISDVQKFQSHYPGWSYKYTIQDIIENIYCSRSDEL